MGIDIRPILVLNDQGGVAVMYITHDVTGMLRHEEHGHPPLVFDARGNGGGHMSDNHRRPPEQNHGLHSYSVKRYTPTSFGQYAERYGTLRASGGDLGGGGGYAHYLLYQRTVGSLCQDDYKGPNRQYADQDKLIIEVCEVITR